MRKASIALVLAGCRLTIPDGTAEYEAGMRKLSYRRAEALSHFERALPRLLEEADDEDLPSRSRAARCFLELGDERSAARLIESAARDYGRIPNRPGDRAMLHAMQSARYRMEHDRAASAADRLALLHEALVEILLAEIAARQEPPARFLRLRRVRLLPLHAKALLENIDSEGPSVRDRAASDLRTALEICRAYPDSEFELERIRIEALLAQYGY